MIMKVGPVLTSLVLLLPTAAWATTPFERFNPLLRSKREAPQQAKSSRELPPFAKRQDQSSSPFLNPNTTQFLVNGTSIPDVDFDVGPSFAGLLPIGPANDGSSLFFWFFPSSAEDSPREIVIWLNGGPGCSSLAGMLQENGPFLWHKGTAAPFANLWSWHHLTNVIWVEQPVGTGFSTGTVTATNEDDLAQQFMGFWKNFVDAFGLQGYSVYVTGESYAGAYCPYIASNMLDANDTAYYDVKGMLIYDPLISSGSAGIAATNYFVQYWNNVFPFNDSAVAHILNASKACGFDDYADKYLTFPPSGQQPDTCQGPGVNADCSDYLPGCDVTRFTRRAALEVNPGFNVYQVAQILPLPDDVLGFPSSRQYVAPGTPIYFNRTDVKRAIHAPEAVDWAVCTQAPVFQNDTDTSDPSSYRAIPNVIARTNNVQIAHGAMDMILLANGTLLGIQNMTWGGQMGFQDVPRQPLFVPHHPSPYVEGTSGQGVLGTWHTERGLTWVLVVLSGHMIPTNQAAVAFRQLQVLLGRVASLSDTAAFPQYADAAQPSASDLGGGTGPPLGIALDGM